MPTSAEKRDAELAALLEEVRSLKQDLDVLKRNPIIGEAVGAALAHARDVARRDQGITRKLPPTYAVAVRTRNLPPGYAVLVKPFELPPDYAVAVRPRPDRDEVVLPEARVTKARAAARKPAKARSDAAAGKTAKARKSGK